MSNGLYGNMLSYFQGQFIDLENFDMLPLINSGYDNTKTKDEEIATVTNFRGCFQNLKGNETKDSNGNLVFVVSGDLWSETKLNLGTFVRDPEDDEYVYRIMKENGWNKEGGFYYYSVDQLVGDDGQLTNDVEFNEGEDNFS